ncbi:MAG: radical SAM protein [Methanobacteriota archaeon]|nr:MAG: radical SAM protein [Euryarchaeota archaeon]
MVDLESIHLLLTYKCDGECDHCFVWSSPRAPGTMTLGFVEETLKQAGEVSSISYVCFEGGEPFLFYPLLAKGVELASKNGYKVGAVSNAYWANDDRDALLWLKPLVELGLTDISVSADEYHGYEESSRLVANASRAANELGIESSVLRVRAMKCYTEGVENDDDGGSIFFRGRAASKLAPQVLGKPSSEFRSCPEEPPNIGRVHIDAYGNVLFCQGISMGNILETPLKDVLSRRLCEQHPVIAPLASGGPAALAKHNGIRTKRSYADACHMCYDVRCRLRAKGLLNEILLPDQSYGD